MCATSDALLWLWSGDFKKFQPNEIKLDNLIHNAIETNRYLITNKDIEIITELAQDTIIANPTLLEILIRNLVRNAFQYTPLGKIEIRWLQGKLTIENTIGDSHQNEISEQSDYGFGVGTHLSKAICESQSWDISISKTAVVFKVAVSFRA